MSYVPAKEMIEQAQLGRYAIPAFNAENLEMIQAIVAAAEEERSPVMIQTTPKTVKYLSLHQAVAMVRAEAERASVPVALHLDHCEIYEDVIRAMDEGYTSVMIDGSKLPYNENVAVVQNVVKEARKRGISVEAELGKLGGKEDGAGAGVLQYTDVEEAIDFSMATKIDYLAVAIGTAHGFYKGTPNLDLDRLEEIHNAISTPLVLHGASGLSDEAVTSCIKRGISKVNIATELRNATTLVVREILKDPKVYDPKSYMGPGRDAVRELCIHKIRVCGSNGKA